MIVLYTLHFNLNHAFSNYFLFLLCFISYINQNMICLFVLVLFIPVNNFSVMSGDMIRMLFQVFLNPIFAYSRTILV